MASTQKLPKHDGYQATTQKSEPVRGKSDGIYRSGANVHKGGAKKDPDGGSPTAQPRQSGWGRKK